MRKLIDNRSRRGASLVELAVTLPLLLLLIVNTVNFGFLFYDLTTVAGAVRDAAQSMVMGSVTINFPGQATASQLTTLIANDLAPLPNAATNVTIKLCTNNGSGGTSQYDQIAGEVNASGNVVSCTCENMAGTAVQCPANEGGNGTATGGDNTDGFSDPGPEANSAGTSIGYTLVTVDISYAYQPPIAPLNFPALHIFTTLVPTTIHRTAVLRMLN